MGVDAVNSGVVVVVDVREEYVAVDVVSVRHAVWGGMVLGPWVWRGEVPEDPTVGVEPPKGPGVCPGEVLDPRPGAGVPGGAEGRGGPRNRCPGQEPGQVGCGGGRSGVLGFSGSVNGRGSRVEG